MTKVEFFEFIREVGELFNGFILNDAQKELWWKAFEKKELRPCRAALGKYYLDERNKPIPRDILNYVGRGGQEVKFNREGLEGYMEREGLVKDYYPLPNNLKGFRFIRKD